MFQKLNKITNRGIGVLALGAYAPGLQNMFQAHFEMAKKCEKNIHFYISAFYVLTRAFHEKNYSFCRVQKD